MRIKQIHHVASLTMLQQRGKQVKRQVEQFELSIKLDRKRKNKAHLSDFDW